MSLEEFIKNTKKPEQMDLPMGFDKSPKGIIDEEKTKKEIEFSGVISENSSQNKDSKNGILWGPVNYQLPGKYHSIGASERVPIYFGSDGKWRVNGKEASEDYALKLISDDEEIEEYNKIIEDIRKIKEKIKT